MERLYGFLVAISLSSRLIASDHDILSGIPPFRFLSGEFGRTVKDIITDKLPSLCEAESHTGWSGDCLEWKNELRLKTYHQSNTSAQVNCSVVSWEAVNCLVGTFEDCFDMSDAHWYGGTVVKEMYWPIELQSERSRPYVTGDSIGTPAMYGGVQERYWMNSNGLALYVDWEVPLWVSINSTGDQKLCLKAQYRDSPYFNFDDSKLRLGYAVCQGNNVREVHDYMAVTYLKRPIDIPDERMFRHPIWSTWAQYKTNITQSLVIEFAAAITENGFSNSQLEIDDKWEAFYGDLDFDPDKFPDPRGMVDALAAMGYRTTIWIHPFVSLDSSAMRDGMQNLAYVTDPNSRQPALTSWWQDPNAMVVDFTMIAGINWFWNRLMDFQSRYNISSFKFDAGETNWLPDCYRLSPFDYFHNPSLYSQQYARMAYDADSTVRHQEVRVGAKTQDLPIFVRMLDKDSKWGYDNGLETVIPHALNVGLIGYPFVLPDMVGGNGYGGDLPDRELFIRWAELNVFLPSVQFSIVPWQFDEEVVEITRNMTQLHESYAQKFIDLARESTVTGAPIVRPLWWIAPTDPEALIIDSEFLVGDDLLVAPVVKDGARSRDIYLPSGDWLDELRGEVVAGPRWLSDYRVELNELPYFTRVGMTSASRD